MGTVLLGDQSVVFGVIVVVVTAVVAGSVCCRLCMHSS